MIEAAIIALLLASPTVTALVASRIQPAPGPQTPTYPHITLQLVSDVEMGYSNLGSDGLREARIQFDVWGQTLVQVNGPIGPLASVLSPRREPGQPVTDLYVGNGCIVNTGREVQRIPADPIDTAGIQLPQNPAARVKRVSIDFKFKYQITE